MKKIATLIIALAATVAIASGRIIRTDKGNLTIKFSSDGGQKAIVDAPLEVHGSLIVDGGVLGSDWGLTPVDLDFWGEPADGFCFGLACANGYVINDAGDESLGGKRRFDINQNNGGSGNSQIAMTDGSIIIATSGGGDTLEVSPAGHPSLVYFDTGLILTGLTLPTCSNAIRGKIAQDGTHGVDGDGHATRLCACIGSGAGTAVWKWTNIITGGAGNTTTCAD